MWSKTGSLLCGFGKGTAGQKRDQKNKRFVLIQHRKLFLIERACRTSASAEKCTYLPIDRWVIGGQEEERTFLL